MPHPRQGTIYALIDPRDNKIRYIGKTTQSVLTRLAGHLAQPTNPAMRVWINSLALQGFTPRAKILSTVPTVQLDREEQAQIHRHAKAGHRLLNSPYYRQHLADLSAPHGHPLEASAVPAPGSSTERKVVRQLFGGLARARAAGKIPAWAVAALVVLGSPAYTTLLAVRQLLRVKPVRMLLGACIVGWPFWESGFDRVVRELLLARLPVEEWAMLWAAYVAGPLNTLAGDLVWPLLVVSALMAASAYSEMVASGDA